MLSRARSLIWNPRDGNNRKAPSIGCSYVCTGSAGRRQVSQCGTMSEVMSLTCYTPRLPSSISCLRRAGE
eukprot:9479859-Pyramimonas_sp.AAC.1